VIVLILVRHAMPAVSADRPPHTWGLSEEGRAAAQTLVASLPVGALLASSAEPKAWETLGGAGSGIRRDDRFSEVGRVGEPWDDDFGERRRRYVEGADHPGWERQAGVAARFEAGVVELLGEASGRPVVLATHGMVLTVWLVSRGVVEAGAAGDFWSGLRFPDCFALRAVDSAWVLNRFPGVGHR
jgi:broad specificity phosphatase PhoE